MDEFLTGFEDAASDDLSSENAEEDFDLIEPTGMGGGKTMCNRGCFSTQAQVFLLRCEEPLSRIR